MVFTVLVAADIYGKVNFEFNFPSVPTMSELRERIETVVRTESSLRRSPGMPLTPFSIHRIQIFDERMEMWVDLVSSSQLEDYCQIYVFQKESMWHKDTPGRIPPPVRPSASIPVYPPPAFPPSSPPPPMLDPLGSIPRDIGSPSIGLPGSVPRGVSPPRGIGMPPDVAVIDPAMSDMPTHGEKVRVVYDELDTRKARAVSLDDWSVTFQKLRISLPDGVFSESTVADLFRKADKNEDGFVSFPEFQVFAELYPKLLDSLYFRCRDFSQDQARKQNIDTARNLLAELERRHDEAMGDNNDAEGATLNQQAKLDAAADAVEEAKQKEKDARGAKDTAHAATEEVRSKVKEAQGDRDRAKEAARQKDVALRGALRGVDVAERKAKQQQGELDKAKKELERIQKMLEAQQREVERQQQALEDATAGIDQAKAKIGEAEDEKAKAEGDVQTAQDHLSQIEAELKAALENEGEHGKSHRDAVKDVNQAQAHRQHEEQELANAKAREAQKKAALDRAQRALDEHSKVVEALEQKDQELEERRREEEGRENELLEQEVRLREQRENVERKEECLRQAHNDFTHQSGRASPLRMRSPYNSSLAA